MSGKDGFGRRRAGRDLKMEMEMRVAGIRVEIRCVEGRTLLVDESESDGRILF